MSEEKVMGDMKQEIRTRMQSLAMPTPKVASEFYTAAEMVKKIRKNDLVFNIFFSRNNSKNQKR